MTRRKSSWKGIFDQILADPQKALDDTKAYFRNVSAGADPIEALHGHVCGPDCWHQQLKKVGKK